MEQLYSNLIVTDSKDPTKRNWCMQRGSNWDHDEGTFSNNMLRILFNYNHIELINYIKKNNTEIKTKSNKICKLTREFVPARIVFSAMIPMPQFPI